MSRVIKSIVMGKYQSGDQVKFEVVDEHSGESEWLWLAVRESNDQSGIVFGTLDSQPIAVAGLKLGQELAVSYRSIKEQRQFP